MRHRRHAQLDAGERHIPILIVGITSWISAPIWCAWLAQLQNFIGPEHDREHNQDMARVCSICSRPERGETMDRVGSLDWYNEFGDNLRKHEIPADSRTQ